MAEIRSSRGVAEYGYVLRALSALTRAWMDGDRSFEAFWQPDSPLRGRKATLAELGRLGAMCARLGVDEREAIVAIARELVMRDLLGAAARRFVRERRGAMKAPTAKGLAAAIKAAINAYLAGPPESSRSLVILALREVQESLNPTKS